jgi:hypothetical protein
MERAGSTFTLRDAALSRSTNQASSTTLRSTEMSSKTTTINVQTTVIDYIQSDLDYATRTDASVNPNPSELIVPYTDGGQTSPFTFVNYSKVAGGGGLASRSYSFTPTTDGTPMFFGMDFQLVIRKDMWPSIMRLELDDKVMLADATQGTTVPQEQMNESHQWNADTGEWQYDPDGKGWQGIGFKPKTPMLLSDQVGVQVNDVRFRWWWNGKHGAAGLWSSLAMAQNSEVFTAFAAKFQNLPLIAAKWGGPIRHPQIQTEYRGTVPGYHAFTITRGRVMHSTQPIAIDLPWG